MSDSPAVVAERYLERWLLGAPSPPSKPNRLGRPLLTQVFDDLGPERSRVVSKLCTTALDPARGPWDLDTTTRIAVFFTPPPTPVPDDLHAPPRFTSDAVDFLLARSSSWNPWVRYAATTTAFSDAQFDRLFAIAQSQPPGLRRHTAPYVQLQITTFHRLLVVLGTDFTTLPGGSWCSSLLILPRSLDDLAALIPYVNATCAARLLMSSHLACYPQPSRQVIEDFVATQPHLATPLATVITNPSLFSGSLPANRGLFTRLLFLVPGLPAALLATGAFSGRSLSTDPPYRRLIARLIPRLFSLSCDPAATSALLTNPAVSLESALQATRALTAVSFTNLSP